MCNGPIDIKEKGIQWDQVRQATHVRLIWSTNGKKAVNWKYARMQTNVDIGVLGGWWYYPSE